MQTAPRSMEMMCLMYLCSGRQPRTIGLLLLNREQDSLHMRFRTDWNEFDKSELDILSNLADDLQSKALELGATALVTYLQFTLSDTLRVTKAETLISTNLEADLYRLEQTLLSPSINFVQRKPALRLTLVGRQWWKDAVTFLEAINVLWERSLTFTRADSRCVMISGASVLTIIAICNSLIQNTKPTLPHRATDQAEMPWTTETKDTNLAPRPLPPLALLHSPKMSKAAKTKVRSMAHSHIVGPIRQFSIAIPPVSSEPAVALILEPEELPYIATELVPPGFENPSLMPPLTPPESTNGVRRLLQALASPFIRMGQGLTN